MPLINTRGAASIKGFGFAGFSPTVPAAPTIGAATATSATTATIAFTAGCSGGLPITGYQAISSPGCITATGSSSPISFSGLTHSTSYTFKVRAQNSLGYGPYSSSSSSITTNNVVPNAPTSVSATATSCSAISVSFTGSSCNGGASIDYYQVVCTSSGSHSATGSSPISITGLSSSTSYTFHVRAHNSVGYSCYSSSTGTATTQSVSSSSLYTAGNYTWVAPSCVSSVSAVAVRNGGSSSGGTAGQLSYKNNISVTPSASYCVTAQKCNYFGFKRSGTYLLTSCGSVSGSTTHCGGSNLGFGGGGGGAAGYSGNGGNGGYCYSCGSSGSGGGAGGGGSGSAHNVYCPYLCCGSGGYYPVVGSSGGGGGGTGLYGQGSSGSGGSHSCSGGRGGSGGSGGCSGGNGYGNNISGGCGGSGGSYGGSNGGSSNYRYTTPNNGGVRIMWPGSSRSFPSTSAGSP